MTQRYDEKNLQIIRATNNLDDNESIFFARELESIKKKTYDIKYANLSAISIIPLGTDVNTGADTVTYDQYDQVGIAKIIANYADDLPRADVKGKEYTAKIRGIGESYGYSLQDIRRGAMTGKSLPTRKATAARRAIEAKINQIAFNGDKEYGLGGLLTNTNIGSYTLTADGTGTTTTFATKTAAQIVRDLNAFASSMVTLTKNVEKPDTILMALAPFNTIAGMQMPDTDSTVLKFFLKNNPYITNVMAIPELDGAGTAGANVMIAYRKDPDVLELVMPQPFEQLAPQAKGLEFEVPCHARCGGVIVYYPLAICKAEGC